MWGNIFWDGEDVRVPKVQGHLCCCQRSIEGMAEVQDHGIRDSLEDFWGSGSLQLLFIKVFSQAKTMTG